MKVPLLIAALTSVVTLGCSTGAPVTVQNSNTSNVPMRAEKLQDTTVHTTENQPPSNLHSGGKWSQSGDPIDTTRFDKAIIEAEKAFKAKPSDETTQKALAAAYYERAFALTEARQYASALGDYRRTMKYDPENAEAKEWIDQIVSIYTMLKKQPPNEGEEPPPLKVKK